LRRSPNNYPEICLLSDKRPIDETILQMEIIPKLNAVGRLLEGYETNRLLKYFSCRSDGQRGGGKLAQFGQRGTERKDQSGRAFPLLSTPNEEALVVLADIPEGLNGLLANRLLQEYEKPVAVFSPSKKDPNDLSRLDPEQRGLQRPQGPRRHQDAPNERRARLRRRGLDQSRGFRPFKKDFLFAALKHKLTPQKEKLIPLNERVRRPWKMSGSQSFGPLARSGRRRSSFELDSRSVSFTYAANGKYLSTPFGKEARLFSFSLGEKAFAV
jgi:hypothetical protein